MVLRSEVNSKRNELHPLLNRAWNYVLDHFDNCTSKHQYYAAWFDFDEQIDKTGWTDQSLRLMEETACPKISVDLPLSDKLEPKTQQITDIRQLVRLGIIYPDVPTHLNIPKEWHAPVTSLLRRVLEYSLRLEQELGSSGYGLSPSLRDNNGNSDFDIASKYDFKAWATYYAKQLHTLANIDREATRAEIHAWPQNNSTAFASLKIWALGDPKLIPNRHFSSCFKSIPDQAFWSHANINNLLHSLKLRWDSLSEKTRRGIEKRLSEGPSNFYEIDERKYNEIKACSILERLEWLQENECVLLMDYTSLKQDLLPHAPRWNGDISEITNNSYQTRSGFVSTNDDYSSLVGLSLEEIIPKAEELTGQGEDFLVMNSPFLGLAKANPVRALSALRRTQGGSSFPEWAWSEYLTPESRIKDKPRLTGVIAQTIKAIPKDDVAKFLCALCDWIANKYLELINISESLFTELIDLVIEVANDTPTSAKSAILHGNDKRDWVTESINSPIGKIVRTLNSGYLEKEFTSSQGIPNEWANPIEKLLSLPGDLARYALVLVSTNLSWCYLVDPKWTEQNLLHYVRAGKLNEEVFWTGVFSGRGITGYPLFQRLKPQLLQHVESFSLESNHDLQSAASLIYSAWVARKEDTGERFVLDHELRTLIINATDDFRCQLLWQAERDRNKSHFKSLMNDVWPKQLCARSSSVSTRLCDIAFRSGSFAEYVSLVKPFLTRLDTRYHPNIKDSTKAYPFDLLELLNIILPEDVHLWAHNIGSYLEELDRSSNLDLKESNVFRTLIRRWNNR